MFKTKRLGLDFIPIYSFIHIQVWLHYTRQENTRDKSSGFIKVRLVQTNEVVSLETRQFPDKDALRLTSLISKEHEWHWVKGVLSRLATMHSYFRISFPPERTILHIANPNVIIT